MRGGAPGAAGGLREGRLGCFVVGEDATPCDGDGTVALPAHLHLRVVALQWHVFMNKKLHVNERFHEKASPTFA